MKLNLLTVSLIILLFGIFWNWWLPGPRVATDVSRISQPLIKSFMDFPRTWSVTGTEGLGEYTVFTLWSWPFSFLNGLFGNLGLSFEILKRILIIVPFLIVGVWGIKKLCGHMGLSQMATFISVLFYLTNTYILLLIDGGQLTIALAYVLFPIAYQAIEKSIQTGYKQKILAGLTVSLLAVFDFRFLYVLFLLSFLRFLYEFLFLSPSKWGFWSLNWIKSGIVLLFIIGGLNFYWLFILFKAPLSSEIYTSLIQASHSSFISLGHAFFMLSPHWFKNVFGQINQLNLEFILVPFLVFLAPILKPRNKIVGFWLLVAILSIFITKGSAEPLSRIYPWLYSNIPGFSLFRDSSKFFFLLALSYSLLIGVTVDEVVRRINLSKIRVVFLLIIISYLIFLVRPVWLGWMTGTFSNPPLQEEFSNINDFISNDPEVANVFWIPTIFPLTSLDSYHPAIEASRLSRKRPFTQATVGSYEIFNYLREASYMGQLFEVANIKYIVYPALNPKRDNLHPDNIKYYNTFSNQLSELPWLSKVENSSIPLWKVNQRQDKFFITPNLWWVIGSDSILNEATKSARLKLSQNALIFAEEHVGLSNRIDELSQAKIVLNNKTDLDLAASFMNLSDLFFPAKNLDFEPDQSGWWKREAADLIRWRDFLQTKYGIDNQDFDLSGGWAVGEGNRELTIDNGQLKKGNILLARVLESTKSGELSFHQGGQLVGRIDTKKEGNNIRWFEVGQLPIDETVLEITSSGDINVVNALAVLNKNEWVSYQDKAKRLRGRIVSFNEENTQHNNNNNPKVVFNKINPTKYMVDINGLTEPAFLVFSQNYDGLWKMDGKTSLPVYSLLNGFNIEKDGQYTIEFEPQKYINPGLIISGLTLGVLILILIKYSKRS